MKVAAFSLRAALLALLIGTAAALAAGPALAAVAPPGAKLRSVAPASVKLPFDARIATCRKSPRTDLRTAVIAASMRPIDGGTKLSLRADLYQRPLSGGRWALRSDVPGLGVWSSPTDPSIGSNPGDVFKYRYAVGRLVVPFAYRFRVTYRWSDLTGRVVREETVTTLPCKEPDLRPDIVIDDVVVEPALDPTQSTYTLFVRNAGRSTAWNVALSSSYAARVGTIRRIGPLETTELTFVAPLCAEGQPGPTFVADPSNAIDEARETNNTLVATCPATLEQP
ncbi:CARDB domain-containing protein [Conexibacter sp. CPCC 206217]|uniref:CARDB domain-containing protein n=1 Tax=Conexibacter sp. CPCC 206217 TaxID=3064574 RepID=UPI002727F80E|nr:CARDB domain-containing protein [Conexibacter sp. CPCC 206217]MDO8213082.1 CARDB domain-containing protein [Conexibacter sp. CPCC 206217]